MAQIVSLIRHDRYQSLDHRFSPLDSSLLRSAQEITHMYVMYIYV